MNGVIKRVRLFGQGAMNGAPTERRGRMYAPRDHSQFLRLK